MGREAESPDSMGLWAKVSGSGFPLGRCDATGAAKHHGAPAHMARPNWRAIASLWPAVLAPLVFDRSSSAGISRKHVRDNIEPSSVSAAGLKD